MIRCGGDGRVSTIRCREGWGLGYGVVGMGGCLGYTCVSSEWFSYYCDKITRPPKLYGSCVLVWCVCWFGVCLCGVLYRIDLFIVAYIFSINFFYGSISFSNATNHECQYNRACCLPPIL